MRKPYTPAELRELSSLKRSAFFADTAAAALCYAADVIEAAQKVIAENDVHEVGASAGALDTKARDTRPAINSHGIWPSGASPTVEPLPLTDAHQDSVETHGYHGGWLDEERARLSRAEDTLAAALAAPAVGRFCVVGGRVTEFEILNAAADERPDGTYTLYGAEGRKP